MFLLQLWRGYGARYVSEKDVELSIVTQHRVLEYRSAISRLCKVEFVLRDLGYVQRE